MATTQRSTAPSAGSEFASRQSLRERYAAVRAGSLSRANPLSAEDQQAQSMPDASPAKWHLAHTTWFFETFLLLPHLAGYRAFDPAFGYLFNSYYEAAGPRHPRPARGLITRPGLDEVLRYRRHVDSGIDRMLADGVSPDLAYLAHHPRLGARGAASGAAADGRAASLRPVAAASGVRSRLRAGVRSGPLAWETFEGGRVEIGASSEGLRLRQRRAAPRDPAAPLSPGQPPGHQRRVDRLHRGRWLQPRRLLALRRMVPGARGGLGRAALLAGGRGWRLGGDGA